LVSVADVPSAGAPPVPAAVELSVGPGEEGLSVVRARDRRALLLVAGVADGFGEDAAELFPGDGSSSGVSSAACSSASAALLGPPCRVIFGMVPSSWWSADWQCGHAGSPTA